MGYIPPKGPPVPPAGTTRSGDDRLEFVITSRGWYHLYWNCVNMKKCKFLGAVLQ